MIDMMKGDTLKVRSASTGPYLILPWMQVDEVKSLLDAEQVRYEVSENIISVNDGPYLATISFGRKGNPAEIQTILDRGR